MRTAFGCTKSPILEENIIFYGILAGFPPAMLVGQNILYLLYVVINLPHPQFIHLPQPPPAGNHLSCGTPDVIHLYRGNHLITTAIVTV